MATPSDVALIKAAFRQADADRSGTISKDEFRTLLQKLDKKAWHEEAVSSLMREVDRNTDNNIQYEEFLDWCMTGGTTVTDELLAMTSFSTCEEVTDELRQEALAFLCHRRRCALFPQMSEALRSDEKLALTLMKDWDVPLKYGSDELRGNRHVLLELLRKNSQNFKYASDELRKDAEVVLFAIREHLIYPWCINDIFEHVPAEITSNSDLMKEAASIQPLTIKFASPELQAEKDLVLAAVNSARCTKYSDALGKDFSEWFPRKHFAGDKDVMLSLVKKMPLLLQKADPELRADRELVQAAVDRHGDALEYASEELRGDRELVACAVITGTPGAKVLQFAATELQDDNDLLQLQRLVRDGSELPLEFSELHAQIDERVAAGGGLGSTFKFMATPKQPLGSTAKLFDQLDMLRTDDYGDGD
eukprot:TRINITY_DN24569_c0_g1_i1.p1 TRINITY_DN24569_c0_g1~~TRINITY_DN24569_c0_g1_i1.p1  ORF type:complete len:435 (+),score=121.98 TRINITY_DN24569_c0_g1_i1:48-1307(+)